MIPCSRAPRPTAQPVQLPRHLVLLCLLIMPWSGVLARPFDLADSDAVGSSVASITLKNGLAVLVAPNPQLPSFTATIHYRVGTGREWQGNYGVCELVASMLMDGTSRLGTPDSRRVAQLLGQLDAIDEQLQRLGPNRGTLAWATAAPRTQLEIRQAALMEELAILSTPAIMSLLYQDRGAAPPEIHVSQTFVQVTITLPANQLSYFMAMESLRLSTFSSRNFYHRRAELARARDETTTQPGPALLRGLAAEVFQIHPYGRYQADRASIIGISRDELQFFQRRYFHPSNVVIVLAGGVDPQDALRLAQSYLAPLGPAETQPHAIEVEEPPQLGERRFLVQSDGPKEVVMAFPLSSASPPPGDATLTVLLELLRNPIDGELADLFGSGLADTLAVGLYPDTVPFATADPAALLIDARAAPATSVRALETGMLEGLAALSAQGPSAERLEGARRRARLELACILERPRMLAPVLAQVYAESGRTDLVEQVYDAIEDVDAELVRELARVYFSEKNRTVATLSDGNENQPRGQVSETAGARTQPGQVEGDAAAPTN